MIYVTEYPDDDNKLPIGPSVPAGVDSLDQMLALSIQEPVHQTPRMVIYRSASGRLTCFSDMRFSL